MLGIFVTYKTELVGTELLRYIIRYISPILSMFKHPKAQYINVACGKVTRNGQYVQQSTECPQPTFFRCDEQRSCSGVAAADGLCCV